jgi:chorismate synthase
MKKILFIATLFLLVSCQKDGFESVKLVYKQVDGCTWLLRKSNGTLLEPTNLGSFVPNPTEGQKVWVKIESKPMMSICMMGETVEIKELKN